MLLLDSLRPHTELQCSYMPHVAGSAACDSQLQALQAGSADTDLSHHPPLL
jgi:hypothetical protein